MKGYYDRMMRALGVQLERLYRDRSGATAVFMATGLVALVAAMGLATDAARGYLVKARLSQALDAAALAGGRAMFSPDRDDDIRMYFHANFPQGYMEAQVSEPIITDVPPVGSKIKLTATAIIPTTLMRVLGFKTMKVAAQTEVTRATHALELVLSIDMSGSMSESAGGGQSRIQAARNAATQLVNVLFGEEAIKSHLKIGVVPWNSKTNVTINGTSFVPSQTAMELVPTFTNPRTGNPQNQIWRVNNSPVPLLQPPPAVWKGCVYTRYIHNAEDDDDGDIVLGNLSSATGDWIAWEPIGPEGEPVSGFAKCTAAGGGWGFNDCGPCLTHGITPMTSAKQDVLDAIDDLQSPDGQTNIPQGLGWAWRVLMPGEPFDDADPNPPGNRQQAIVLLTDGENVGGYGDGYRAEFGLDAAAQDDMDNRLRLLAANIKASGVLIYTIQFANSGTAMQDLLKEVATQPGAPYYHYAPDGATLQQVFQEIANHLSQLHLSM